MKFIKGAHKAWSTWGIALIVLAEGTKALWPVLSETLPTPVYDWGLFTLGGIVLFLRFVDQGLSDADSGKT